MKILYICTHNRCRSILSEAITNHFAHGIIQAKSAGSQPCGEVHPLSLHYLQEAGISIQGLQSQSWHEFESFQPDVVITVCDSAADEVCPVWVALAIGAGVFLGNLVPAVFAAIAELDYAHVNILCYFKKSWYYSSHCDSINYSDLSDFWSDLFCSSKIGIAT